MDGASADKEVIIDLNKYLPENVELADSNSKIHVTLKVEPLETRTIELKNKQDPPGRRFQPLQLPV